MIDRFNFYDLYGYAIPGLILMVLFWVPFGLTAGQLPTADLGSAVLAVAVAYVIGHIVQILADRTFPSTIDGRYPSDIVLDDNDRRLCPDLKRQVLDKIELELEINVRDSAFSNNADERRRNRNDAFLLCRAALVKNDKLSYAQQFQGMYVLMRGLVAAFLLGSLFQFGWASKCFFVRWGLDSLLRNCLEFTDHGISNVLQWDFGGKAIDVVVALPFLVIGVITLVLVAFHNRMVDPKKKGEFERYWIWCVASLVPAMGSAVAPAGGLPPAWSTSLLLIVIGTMLLFFAYLCRSAHLRFAEDFAKTVYRDFILIESRTVSDKAKPRGSL